MKITISGKGIHRREIAGIGKLRELPGHWYCFTNLELIEPGSMPRQIDVIIVLDDRILIVDLKDWSGTITSDADRWFQNNRYVDTSPVKKILENARVTASSLRSFLTKNLPRGTKIDLPLVEGCVVLTNKCDISGLVGSDKNRVFRIDDFCKFIQDPQQRKVRLARGWETSKDVYTATDGKWRPILARFFDASGSYFKPLEKRYGEYRVVSDETYHHPKHIYAEYDVEEVSKSQGFGLLRMWDFSLADPRYASEDGRMEIAGREQNVITFLVDRQPDLESVLIHPKVSDFNKGVHYWEVFERRRQLKRLREFLASHSEDLTTGTRIDLARTLLSHLASVHRIGAAHLDLGDHSVWLELPSVIRVSHLVAASLQELSSLGDRRFEFLASGIVLPESIVDQPIDHLRKDVFLLAVVIHTILFGKPPVSDGSGNPPAWNSAVDVDGSKEHLYEWFKKGLDDAASERYANAQEMLDAFNNSIKDSVHGPNGVERLQRYRPWKSFATLFRKYTPSTDELLKETDRITSWISVEGSTPVLIKAWRSSCWGDEVLESPRLAKFCEDAEDLILTQPAGVNRLLHVGYMGDHLALVQEYVDVPNLAEHLENNGAYWAEPANVARFLSRLASVITDLHQGGRSHGDLTPSNILVVPSEQGYEPLLIDLLDFGPADEGWIRTPAYSPANDVGTRERDRYGVLKIAEEMFARSQLDETSATWLSDALQICRHTIPILATLSPLSEALAKLVSPPIVEVVQIVTVSYPGVTEGLLVPDEGRYYVYRKPAQIIITGETEELILHLHHQRKGEIKYVRRVPVKQSQVAIAEKRSNETIHIQLETVSGFEDVAALRQLLQLDLTEPAQPINSLPPSVESSLVFNLYADAGLDEDVSVNEEDSLDDDTSLAERTSIDVPALWEELLKVEEEQITKGVAEGESFYNKDKRRHFVSFQVTTGALDFARDEEVRVELLNKAKNWTFVGILDLDLSRNDEVVIDAARSWGRDGAKLCTVGSELRFRSTLESENRSRRTVATSRILERKSIYPDLIDYFSGNVNAPLAEVPSTIDPELIAARYGLNASQASAFVKICATKPLSLLQGPPGTGKTKFIAALVHYLLSNGVIKNVLLASQSNEAVNNATEGVLRLFRMGDAEPSLIRVGQEGQISETLKAYHSVKVEAHYREQFRAGLKQRFEAAAKHIGLSQTFSDDLFLMESTVWPVHQQLLGALKPDEDQINEETHRRVTSLFQTLSNLQHNLRLIGEEEINWYQAEAYDLAITFLSAKHKIQSAEQVRRLRGVAVLARDWMGSVTSRQRSFEEFLANTREIVSGTCVGLGRSSLGLSKARFDLVIIDEAARCTSSELAVPMQAGKWILLVGDHLQLEPFHEAPVVRETQLRLQIPKSEIIRSDFERAFASSFGKQTGQTLTIQYRMLPHIGDLVSKVFYHGLLMHGRKAPIIPDAVLPDELKHQLSWLSTDRFGEKAYQRRSGRNNTSLSNPTEANAIADLLRRLDSHQPFVDWLASHEFEQKAIGIICTYGAQSELIKQKLRAIGLSPTMLNSCKVDTVDSYQGKENPIVILSLVRNNEDGKANVGQKSIITGFMSRANRINVALSRAMDKLIIVGAFQRWPAGGTMDRVTTVYHELFTTGSAHIVEATADIEAVEVTPKVKAVHRNHRKGKGNVHRR